MRTDHVISKLDPSIRLTIRRIEIIDLLKAGLVEKEIGVRLNITRDTVAEHLGEAMRLLGAHTSAQLVALAAAHGFIELPVPPPPAPDGPVPGPQ